MTVKEAAERLEVTPKLVYKLCEAGRIRHRRIGVGRGVIRIDDEQLEEFRRSCEVGLAPPGEEPAREAPAGPRAAPAPDYFARRDAERARSRAERSKNLASKISKHRGAL